METPIIFLNLIVMIFLLAIAWSVCIKVLRLLASALSFFTYLGLYGIEAILSRVKILKFNLPSTPQKRIAADFLGSLIFIFGIFWVWYFVRAFVNRNNNEIVGLFTGQIIPFQLSLIIVSCLVALYVISYFSRTNADDAIEKINKIRIPDIIKSFFGV